MERFCAAASDADLILIADTGSDDGTQYEAVRCGAVVFDICVSPWRFDVARNAALALVPRDVDVCISVDLDEILQPGWRNEVERLWATNTTRLRYVFDWGKGIQFYSEKVHARHGYVWRHPCHEYPVADPRMAEVMVETQMLLITHHPDDGKSRSQYMELLELAVKEDPACARNAFYFARELTFNARWSEAIGALRRYLAMPQATWNEERCYAMRILGKSFLALGEHEAAEGWVRRACAEAPNSREPWCDLATLMYQRQKWEDCYAASVRALSITNRAFVYTTDPSAWGYLPHDLASISAWNMGLMEVAIEQAALAVAASPNDERLLNNLELVSR